MQATSDADGTPATPDFPQDSVDRQGGLIYAHRTTGDLALDLYRPAADHPVPVVIWLHGGGWFTGDRTLAPDLARYFAARGLAMASIDYRLSGTALFPAPLHDVRAAIRHLRGRSAELGLDPAGVGLWGASAGGHLAALAGLTGHLDRLDGEPLEEHDAGLSPSVRAVAESYGPVDLAAVVGEAQESLPGRDAASSPEAMLLGGPPAERPELARQANPLTWVTPQAPPFQISHGTGDALVSHRQSERLHAALVQAGVPSELYLLDGFRHGFLNPAGRLDVEVARVMDDGRLEAEGPVPAQYRTSESGGSGAGSGTGTGAGAESTFSFDTIGDFLVRHLSKGHLS